MRTQLLTPFINVSAGQTFQVQVEVYNTGALIDGVVGRLVGIDPTWVQGGGQTVSLFPDTSEILTLEVTLPREYPAGQHTLVLEVRSNVDVSDGAVHQVRLDIQPRERVRLDIRPQILLAGRKGTANVQVQNKGNQPVELQLSAADAERIAECTVAPADLLVRPGHDMDTKLSLKARRPFFGSRVDRQVLVIAQGGDEELSATMTFRQKPWITRGVLTAITLVFIVALWAFIFTFGISALLDDAAAEKAIPGGNILGFVLDDANADGEPDGGGSGGLALEEVAGTISGLVVADTTAEGLARITVEAYRQGRAGFKLAGSVATDEGGAFELGSLLPGQYQIRFTGQGFVEEWFPDVPAQGGALLIPLEPTGEINLAELPNPADPTTLLEGGQLEGNPGTVRGTVLTDSTDEEPGEITITATPVFSDDAPEVSTVADGAGEYVLTGLLTPGQYTLRVTSADFRTESFLVTLAGGEVQIVNTVKLVAADGAIGGTVRATVAGALTDLGGVDITITRGEFEATTTTPTSGSVGTYLFSELETPGTYVLSFSKDGFGTKVLSLALEPAGKELAVDVELTEGTGALTGIVFDSSGQGLGGVTVTVTGSNFSTSTTSLTDGGSYQITGIPTPGQYTVTFSLAGYTTRTQALNLAENEQPDPINETLAVANAAVSGNVLTGGNSPVGEVIVELTDGVTVRSTVGSTPTAGGPSTYRFSGLAPGSYTLTATSTGYVSESRLIRLTEGQQASAVDFDLAGAGSLTGLVQAAGDPAPDISVRLTGLGGVAQSINLTTTTGAAGDYSFSPLPPGTYKITVTAPDGTTIDETVATSVGLTVAPTIELRGTLTVIVTVTPPTSGAVVTVSLDGGPTEPPVQVGDPGDLVFTFVDLESGFYTVNASASGSIATPKSLTVGPGPNSTTITIVLSGTINGVILQEGSPTAGINVQLKGPAPATTTIATTTTGSGGTYSFANVAPGTYTISGNITVYTGSTSGVVVTSGETTTASFEVFPP